MCVVDLGLELDRILLVTTERLVNVSEAARILSVSTKTIRRWDAKLGPRRDGNGYRVYEPLL